LQLKVNAWTKLESAIDAILWKKCLNLEFIFIMTTAHLNNDWWIFRQKMR
jgi:hypothetical protein